MRVRVLLFAILRDLAGTAEVPLELEDGATAQTAADAVAERHPSLNPYLSRIAFALNRQYVPKETELHEGDEVALIPPVSGG